MIAPVHAPVIVMAVICSLLAVRNVMRPCNPTPAPQMRFYGRLHRLERGRWVAFIDDNGSFDRAINVMQRINCAINEIENENSN